MQQAVEATIEEITTKLAAGNEVKFAGLGKFSTAAKPARVFVQDVRWYRAEGPRTGCGIYESVVAGEARGQSTSARPKSCARKSKRCETLG